MTMKFANMAATTLLSAIAATDTTITLVSGSGALFPTLSSTTSDYFYGVLVDSSGNLDEVKVTARSGDVLTVTRNIDGYTPRAFAAGSTFAARLGASALNDLVALATSGGGTNSYQVASLGVGTAASGTAGEIRATNNITGYYSSDAQFKENVREIESALGVVKAVGGKLFDWTDAYIEERGGEDGYFVRKSDFGVVAQDVQKVFPLAIRVRPDDGSLAVDYAKLCAVAFAAINELRHEVDRLRQEVRA